MGRAAAHGLTTIESKSRAELDDLGNLTPVTSEDLHVLGTSPGVHGEASVLEQWVASAEDHREYVPDRIDLEAIAATVVGGRP